MMNKARILKVAAQELFQRIGGVPLLYYCGYPNFGDVLGRDIFSALSPCGVYRPLRQRGPHLIFLGSLLTQANAHSVVLGSGFIKEVDPISVDAAYFVRGEYSKKMLKPKRSPRQGVALADAVQVLAYPPLLKKISEFYREKAALKLGACGERRIVVLHHITFSKIFGGGRYTANAGNQFVISTGAPVEVLFEWIRGADAIVSDALHPLILADTLKVPNKWISVDEATDLLGGDYKFFDYATQRPGDPYHKHGVQLDELIDCGSALFDGASVRSFTGDGAYLAACVLDAINGLRSRSYDSIYLV